MRTPKLATIFAIVFVDLLGFGLILPLVPFYAKLFGASDFVAGLLVASYALAQFIGAPLLGRMSDRFGRRPILLVSIAGTVLGFVMLGFAGGLWMLFLSRVLDGLTGGNITVAQAYIADITDEKNRAKGLGLIGAAFGLGFIIGPAFGGFLYTVGQGWEAAGDGRLIWEFALPALAAAALALANLIAVYFYLPESLDEARRAELAKYPRQEFSLANMRAAFSRPRIGPLLSSRFFFGLSFSTFQTIFPLWALNHLGLEANQTAYVLTYVGFLAVLVQGFLIGRLTARFSEISLTFWSVVIMAGSLLGWAFTPSVPVLLIVLAPLAFSGGILSTTINSLLSKSVYPEEIGGTLGLSSALESATRVIGPSAGGYLLGSVGAWAPGIASALISGGLAIFVWRRLIANPDPPLPKRAADPVAASAE